VDAFHEPTWSALTVPGGRANDPYWKPALLVEAILNAALAAWGILNLVLFFRKRKSFPRSFIACQFTALGGGAIACWLSNNISNLPDVTKSSELTQLLRQGVYCAVWIPYMLKSVRVRNTFIK
jgi:hypothetical protein